MYNTKMFFGGSSLMNLVCFLFAFFIVVGPPNEFHNMEAIFGMKSVFKTFKNHKFHRAEKEEKTPCSFQKIIIFQ